MNHCDVQGEEVRFKIGNLGVKTTYTFFASAFSYAFPYACASFSISLSFQPTPFPRGLVAPLRIP